MPATHVRAAAGDWLTEAVLLDELPGEKLETRAMIITIPGTPPSWNTFYAGAHHWKRKKLADQWHLLTRAAVDLWAMVALCRPLYVRAAITITVNYPDARRRDPDNICAKLLIDGLVHAGVLADDSDAFVSSVTTRITRDRTRPRETTVVLTQENQPCSTSPKSSRIEKART